MRAPAAHALARDVDLLGEAADRFRVAVTWAHPRAPVAGCPGWSTYDLAVHLGNVHAWAATIVETGQRAVEQNDGPRSSRGRVIGSWYAGKAEDLLAVLRDVEPARPCWNFAQEDGSVAFWLRRQLHETTIHLADLQLACGRTPEIDSAVAVDGVSEVLEVLTHRMHARRVDPVLSRPLALAATDTGDTWVLTPSSDGGVPGVRRDADDADDAEDRVAATAEVLYRLLWHRGTDEDDVRLGGDATRVRAYLGSRLTPLTRTGGQRPWLATARIASAAASGSRYSPPGCVGRRCSSSR